MNPLSDMARKAEWHKRRHPLCFDPFGEHVKTGAVVPVAQTHHVVSVESRADLSLDEDNCVSLCVACHGRIEGMERSGRSTACLFEGGGAP